MKWLELSTDAFEPIPDIRFSWKKPLFAASVVLKYTKRAHGIHATAETIAKIPIKGSLHYLVEAQSAPLGEIFAFSLVKESDLGAGSYRKIHAKGTTLSIESSSDDGDTKETVDISNLSPAPILAHVFILPAFQQTRDSRTHIYAGHVAVGAKDQALRIEKVSHLGEIESYEAKLMNVEYALTEHEWHKLPWKSKKGFGFNWHVENRTVTSASFHVPIIGQIEIKA